MDPFKKASNSRFDAISRGTSISLKKLLVILSIIFMRPNVSRAQENK
ncbi:hypothetical protein LEP1GSC075_2892 [Leptospira interrogans str. Kito]|nr:hypothetical protein LEP1GSC069_0857 [Leptospira interrogans serovar Canicola str. Fiocruz LV133]EMK16479.1 hypothetical protein LEP1GSC075_2892 [Leptospira interrogans str. Kito]EMN74315.1 hypothetical protein LEP1GSC102_4370 [Leptospira interrogans str. UI 09600]